MIHSFQHVYDCYIMIAHDTKNTADLAVKILEKCKDPSEENY